MPAEFVHAFSMIPSELENVPAQHSPSGGRGGLKKKKKKFVYCAAKTESSNIRQVSKGLRCYGHSDMRNKERMPKQIVTA